MNVHSWKYSIHRLCMACYCNTHLSDQSSELEGFDSGTRVQCCAGLPCSVPSCGHAVTPGCRTVSVSAIWRCTRWYECSLPPMGVPACASSAGRMCWRAAAKALTFPSALSDCFWEKNPHSACSVSDFHQTHTHTQVHSADFHWAFHCWQAVYGS